MVEEMGFLIESMVYIAGKEFNFLQDRLRVSRIEYVEWVHVPLLHSQACSHVLHPRKIPRFCFGIT